MHLTIEPAAIARERVAGRLKLHKLFLEETEP